MSGNKRGSGQPGPSAEVGSTAARWRLRRAARAILTSHRAFVATVQHPYYIEIPRTGRDQLIDIAMGRCTHLTASEPFSQLIDAGFLAWSADVLDRDAYELLRRLDERFAWMMPRGSGELHYMAVQNQALRKISDWRFFQGPCRPETAARRALLVADRRPGVEIVLLGDDDLVAPLLAHLGCRVTVVDIDANLLATEQELARLHGVNFQTLLWNMADPVPAELQCRFAACMVDPMSQTPWFEVTLSRSIGMLKPGGSIYLSVYGRADREAGETWEYMGLVEEARHNRFSHYFGHAYDDVPAYDSDLIVLNTRNAKPVVGVDERWQASFEPNERLRYGYMIDAAGCDPIGGWTAVEGALHDLLVRAFGQASGEWVFAHCGSDRVSMFNNAAVTCRMIVIGAERRLTIDFLAWGDVSLLDVETFLHERVRAERIAMCDMLRKI
jgi:hypothetical protein